MIFSSFPFILVYLPVVLLGVVVLRVVLGRSALLFWLTAASLVFYAYWNPVHLPLLLGSIAVNYALGLGIARAGQGRGSLRLVWLGAAFNLALLGYFKYRNFLLSNAVGVLGEGVTLEALALPLAISFFTFQQIAWLVDLRRGRVRIEGPLRYAFFVSFFPQLIAGPIVHYREIMPQVRDGGWLRFDGTLFATGVFLFAVGMAKKVLLADAMAPAVDAVYAAGADGGAVSALDAWTAAFGFGLQLYFDFSGYADMALGLAAMLGLRLPVNFWSPYRAGSVIAFWRRWHITLSRFLRDHVYIPLGGRADGLPRRLRNLMVTMLLGGLWHGAGWTFVLWGGVHGLMLSANHLWRRATRGLPVPRGLRPLGVAAGFVLTFTGVMLAWIPFRAPDIATAWRLTAALWPPPGSAALPGAWDSVLGVTGGSPAGLWLWCVLGVLLVFALPNALRLVQYRDVSEDGTGAAKATRSRPLLPPLLLGVLAGALILASLKALLVAPSKEFFYFAF